MRDDIRDKALAVLLDPQRHTPLTVHNAIIDLRRNGERGDQHLLQKFLDYPGDMAAAAALYSLIHVYEAIPGLFERLLQFADGDTRDAMEKPIQTQAIEGLATFARTDPRAIEKLISVAISPATPETPRARAWRCLADLFGVPWKGRHAVTMIQDPDSERSEKIRNEILNAIESRKSKPI